MGVKCSSFSSGTRLPIEAVSAPLFPPHAQQQNFQAI